MKTAIVTGATKGIGRAAALALGRDGWWVLATGRDESSGKEVADSLMGLGGGEFVTADLTDEGVPSMLVQRVVSSHGGLDCIVNNAGIHFLASLDQTAVEDYDRLMAINLRASVMMARAAVEPMRASGGGVIINVSSEAGVVAVPGQVAYNISKAGLIMLTRSIAADHAKDGIRAVSICPGTTLTPLVEEAIASAPDPDAHAKWLASSRPVNRLGTPEEVGDLIAFVASDKMAYMTGSEIVIDGGYTAV
jgi:NAD(P)-dependent dehydrogenase (short-subunit alcohol dehydrogenase family)